MDFDGVWGMVQALISLAICLAPFVLVGGAVVVLVVILARSRPKAATQPKPSRKPAPAKAKPAASRKTASASKAATKKKPSAAKEPSVKACASCGAENPADNAFCEYCGEAMTNK